MRAPLAVAALLLASCSGPVPNLKSQDPYERFLGERELVGRTDAEAIRELVDCLEDSHYLVVIGALDLLGGMDRPEFLQHFVPKLKHKHPLVREAACAAVAATQSEEGLPPLIELLKDPDPGVRRAALKALARYPKNPPALAAMVEMVGDKDPSVSYMAHRLLTDITGRTDVPQSKAQWIQALK